MNKYLPTILLLVGLAAGFAGGYFFKNYQQNKLRNNLRNGMGITNGQRFVPNNGQASSQNRGMMFGGGVEGDIISMDDKSVTVKLTDGSTKIVLFSDSTIYSNILASKKTDLKQGIKIAVFGKTNTDGSVTADRIQLNPIITQNGSKSN
jgi:hypothetical protein